MAPRARKSGDHDLKAKKNFFKRMYPGFKKKATELSVLCDNSVCFISYGPDVNDLHVWPSPQDDPQALPEILAKFNALSHQRRMNHACDLFDFPPLKGLSHADLTKHLATLDSHLLGINQKKLTILRRGNSQPPKDTDHLIRVSDNNNNNNATISNRASSDDQLGFDELGKSVFLGSHESFSQDVGLSDSFTFPDDDYFPVDLTPPATDYFPVDYLSPTDLDFLATLFPDDPLLLPDDSSFIYQSEHLGSAVF